jgi:hypothetical protein
MNTEVTETTAFKAMQTDIQVSMDDVVSAFVSQYENNLFERKKELAGTIRGLEKELCYIDKAVLTKVTGETFSKQNLPFNLKITVDAGVIQWNTSNVAFSIAIKQNDSSRYGNTITFTEYKPVPVAQVRANERLSAELSVVRSELSEVLVSLKSVTRKERQVRGRIAIRKLEDSGYANLMQDEELVKLVQLDV